MTQDEEEYYNKKSADAGETAWALFVMGSGMMVLVTIAFIVNMLVNYFSS